MESSKFHFNVISFMVVNLFIIPFFIVFFYSFSGMKNSPEPERAMVDLSGPSSPIAAHADSHGGSDEYKALYLQEQMAHQKLKAEVSILVPPVLSRMYPFILSISLCVYCLHHIISSSFFSFLLVLLVYRNPS